MLICNIWLLNWLWTEDYELCQAVIWLWYRNKCTIGLCNLNSETHKENLVLVLKQKSLSRLKVKEFPAVFKRYYYFDPFPYKPSPHWYCAITYYFNSHYSFWIYHNNMSQVEYILMREYAVFILLCISSLWSAVPCSKWTGVRQCMWRKNHITSS